MSSMSRREIVDQFVAWRNASGDSNQRTLVEQLLTRAYHSIWLDHPWQDHRLPGPVTVTTVANTRAYVLPAYFGRVPPMVETLKNLTSGRGVSLLSKTAFEGECPLSGTDLETAGVPYAACIAGMVGVSVQPSSSGQALEVVSDHASDTDVRVLVEGVDGNGHWNETQVTLNGTTAVGIGTWKDPIINFSKAYPAGTDPATAFTSSRGTVALRVASAGATLQSLLPEESAREFPSLTLYPKPVTAGEVIAIPTIRAPKRLLYDADECPRHWGPALLERMNELWSVAAGTGDTPGRAGPEVVKLVAFDNSSQPGRLRTQPFRG